MGACSRRTSLAHGEALLSGEADMSGGLVCLCGIDGTGKTVHARHLAARLRAGGMRARAVATLSRGAEFLRVLKDAQPHASKQTMADLIAFERYRRVRRVIVPALARQETIICDRYFYTDIVYALANNCDPSLARSLLTLTPRPDVIIILQAPLEVTLSRSAGRSVSRGWAPAHTAEFLTAAAKGFEQVGAEVGAKFVETNRSFGPVADEIYRVATARLSTTLTRSAAGARTGAGKFLMNCSSSSSVLSMRQ